MAGSGEKFPAFVGVRRVEGVKNAVVPEQVPQLVRARRPLISQGASLYGVTFLQGERTVATVKLGLDRRARPDQPYRGVVILNQARVGEVPRARLDTLGGAVERSRELVGFHEVEDVVAATVRDTVTGETEEIHASYMVGCDERCIHGERALHHRSGFSAVQGQ